MEINNFVAIDSLASQEDWQDRRICKDEDPEIFFPEKENALTTAAAKEICRRCTARPDCLSYALEIQEQYGVWGGMDTRERRKLLKKLTKPQAA